MISSSRQIECQLICSILLTTKQTSTEKKLAAWKQNYYLLTKRMPTEIAVWKNLPVVNEDLGVFLQDIDYQTTFVFQGHHQPILTGFVSWLKQ